MKKFILFCLFPSTVFADVCDEYKTLALNIYHEARGEGYTGMQMVGEVTLNRVESRSHPDNICDVVYQPYQFSWTHTVSDVEPKEEEIWEQAEILAENLINGEIEYLNTGATHFLNPDAVSKIPRWTRVYEKVGRVGNHVFYTDGSKREEFYIASSSQ